MYKHDAILDRIRKSSSILRTRLVPRLLPMLLFVTICTKMGREPERSHHVHDDLLCVLLCMVFDNYQKPCIKAHIVISKESLNICYAKFRVLEVL